MLRIVAKSAVVAIAAALLMPAGALQAQSSENLAAKLTARRVIQAPSPSTWIDRYASMLGVGAEQGRVPISSSDAKKRLLAMRVRSDSLRVLTASLMPSRRIECPMPVAKADSGRFADMKIAPRQGTPRDSEPQTPWVVNGRLIGCTNPLAK